MLSDSNFVAKGLNISCASFGDSTYVLFENDGSLIELNEIGSFIWACLSGTRQISEIQAMCEEVYDGDRVIIQDSVREFIASLLQMGAIEISESKFAGEMQHGN